MNGTFKKLTTFLSYREEFPISWSSATVSRRILYLIYLNEELLNVPLWVMSVIALHCLDLDVLFCYSHDYLLVGGLLPRNHNTLILDSPQ